jgi:hypothetical protein
MAIRNDGVYGTDWSDGNTLDAADLNDTNDAILLTRPPIGSVIAWLKSFTSVPALADGWVECDGSTISDSNSPMNGQTLPDLNSPADTGLKGMFLRGHTTSGSTETSQNLAHTHSHSLTTSGSGTNALTGSIDTNGGFNGTVTTTSNGGTEARPHNYSVVWIMRIK